MPAVLITGGHGGLGFAAATRLAAVSKSDLILAGRSLDSVRRAADSLRTDYGVSVAALRLDLASLDSVRAAAEEARVMLSDGISALICNAGVRMRGAPSYTVDGYEETFAVNHLGHFLLANLLLDRMDEHGRIVFTCSGTHDPDRVDGRMVGRAVAPDADALAYCGKDGHPAISSGQRYSTSKLCNVMTVYELDRRLRAAHAPLSAIAFDPGSVSGTGFLRSMPAPVRLLSRTGVFNRIMRMAGVTMGSLQFSGECLARVAADPEFADASGKYFESNGGSLLEARSSQMSYDANRAAALWADSERLVRLGDAERPKALEQSRP